ncbi:hypothetical protein HMPREF9004_1530 [Schaalia cardiffensis F0333]|uniref:Uncharacterized protein n=1 Tax=Schaalia cardiffensis F0333 TaxID=888050 RepID=N6W515_9ACTO|nr:hypothetical protein HMPREF9004_1530 [Schaalia cardiffensis F0333]
MRLITSSRLHVCVITPGYSGQEHSGEANSGPSPPHPGYESLRATVYHVKSCESLSV